MTLCSLKISKTFKTLGYQQYWLNLKKVMAPSMKNEKKTPLLPTTFINRFERNCGTFRGRGGKNSKPIVVNDTGLVSLYIYIYIYLFI